MKTEKKRTPVMQQFADAKAEHPDAILFFRLGDFYEMFFDDAVYASKLLGLTLTSRQKEDRASEPMCGVPHHSAHVYIAKLLAAGRKVALCEQLADPSKTKGIVPRAVVRVLTPGLVTSEEHLEAKENLFLAAIEAGDGEGKLGLALLDFSTGEVFGTEVLPSILGAELVRYRAREVLVGPGAETVVEVLGATWAAVCRADATPIGAGEAAAVLREIAGAAASDGAHAPLALRAMARALLYAKACSPRGGVPVRSVRKLPSGEGLYLDETAQAHLELVRTFDGKTEPTLLSVVDRTVTAGGGRLLRRRLLAPLSDVAQIRARLDEVEAYVVHAKVRGALREVLADVPDLERVAVRISIGEAGPRDLGALRDGLRRMPEARKLVESLPQTLGRERAIDAYDALMKLGNELDGFLVEAPPTTAKEGGAIREGVDAELDESRRLEREGTAEIAASEARLRAETGAQTLRIRFNSVFGWYVEVTKSQLAKVPASFKRKQTVAGGERYTTAELDQLAADISRAADAAREREGALLLSLLAKAKAEESAIRAYAATLAAWDVASALAELAHERDYAKPTVDEGERIDIAEGRHPVVESVAARGSFVPNDTLLDLRAGRLLLVTGPNMAGKSTLMRQVALITLLAQMGSFVPAKRAHVGVVDRLLSRVGAADNLARGESTFMVEMRETAAILRQATSRSLVILDEIGRGTSTYDGLAIAWAVAEHLHDAIGCRALFATHYHELTELSKTAQHLVNVSVSAREHDGGIVFLHTLLSGPASKSYGIAVAKLAGLPASVLSRAETLCEALEQGTHREKSRSSRGRGKEQLGLFSDTPPAPEPKTAPALTPAESDALRSLREATIESMTPLDALNLLARLSSRLRN